MASSFTISRSISASGANASSQNTYTGKLVASVSESCSAAGTTQVPLKLDVSEIEALFIKSTVAGTLKTNAKQVETATVVGAIGVSGAGNATVIVTAVGLVGSPRTVSVAVSNSDSASTVGGKIRTALNAVTEITDFFTVSGSGASVVLTANAIAPTDSTMNISIANGTCSGLTAAPTSVASSGDEDESLAMVANVPYVWTSDDYDTCKFATDINTVYFDVPGATAGVLSVVALT